MAWMIATAQKHDDYQQKKCSMLAQISLFQHKPTFFLPLNQLPPVQTSPNTQNFNQSVSEKPSVKSGTEITSPIIGTAYHAPEPGAKKFVEVGKKIKKGDTIMIVEAMKTMNHVPSTQDGVVKEICVEDGHPVEFGQTIIILE